MQRIVGRWAGDCRDILKRVKASAFQFRGSPAAGLRGRRNKRRWRTSGTPSASTSPPVKICCAAQWSAKSTPRA